MTSPQEGSSLYYSLLWTEPSARARFVNRLNFVNALNTTLDEVQEPQVAERKIHWWHEELQRMLDGQPRHPATQACHESLQPTMPVPAAPAGIADSGVAEQFMATSLTLLSSVSNTRFSPAATDEEADAHMIQNVTSRLALLCHALSNDSDDLTIESHPATVTLAFAKHERLIRLPYLLHRGHPVFSDETYKRHGIRPTDLASLIRVAPTHSEQDKTTPSSLAGIPVNIDMPGRKTLMAAAVTDTHTTLHVAVNDKRTVKRYRQGPLLPLWRLLVLREKQAAAWQKKQPDLLRERTTLTPLVKFMTAWRNKR